MNDQPPVPQDPELAPESQHLEEVHATGHVEPVVWSASEYIAHEKTTTWYALLGVGGAVLVAVVFLTTRDVFASLVVILICAAMAVFAGRQPSTKNYVVSDEGIQVDGKPYAYSLFRSFSIVEEGGMASVWLQPLRRFAPPVVMYFAPEDEDRIADALAVFLAYEQLELDAIDRLSKRMRF